MSTIEKALAKQKEAALKNSAKSEIEPKKEQLQKNIKEHVPVSVESKEVDTYKNKEEIILNGDRLTERGFIYSPDSAHHIQEEFRHIKRKLLNNAFGATAKT